MYTIIWWNDATPDRKVRGKHLLQIVIFTGIMRGGCFVVVITMMMLYGFSFQKSKEIPGNQATEGIERKLTILIGELMPGELYHFQVYTTAHEVNSKVVELSSRTSEYRWSAFSV